MANNFTESKRVSKMHSSSTLKAAQMAASLRDEGHSVIDLTVGEPDFETPQFIKEFAIEGMQKGLTRYTASRGMKLFTENISRFYAEQFNASFAPTEVVAACGGKQALFNALCTLLDPGDDVLIPQPYWVTFPEIVTFCEANPVYVNTEDSDLILTAELVKAAITPKTRALILNSPNNPTGRVIPKDELIDVIRVCAERGIYVITDECYLYFAYPPGEVFTSASLPDDLRKFVCVAGSFSKTFAMTGWRIGYTIANEEWSRAMVKLQSHSATHPTSFVQYACAKALEEPATMLEAVGGMLNEYERRRDWLIPALQTIKGFNVSMPEGAFYAFVDVRQLLGDRFASSSDVADAMLKEAHTAVTDGAGFGADGFLRFSYATSLENLQTAVERLSALFGTKPQAGFSA